MTASFNIPQCVPGQDASLATLRLTAIRQFAGGASLAQAALEAGRRVEHLSGEPLSQVVDELRCLLNEPCLIRVYLVALMLSTTPATTVRDELELIFAQAVASELRLSCDAPLTEITAAALAGLFLMSSTAPVGHSSTAS